MNRKSKPKKGGRRENLNNKKMTAFTHMYYKCITVPASMDEKGKIRRREMFYAFPSKIMFLGHYT